MPGRKSYGPPGKWIHDRAHNIMQKGELTGKYGDKQGKSVAYAIAVQQAHKLGKSPKGFRTSQGVRTAKKKFSLPKKEYRKTAAAHIHNWGNDMIKTATLYSFFDELEQIEKDAGWGKKLLTGGLLAATLAGGGKAMSKNIAKAGLGSGRAAITQTVKKAPSSLRMGGATSQARKLRNMGILP